jgi:hypothetical protein
MTNMEHFWEFANHNEWLILLLILGIVWAIEEMVRSIVNRNCPITVCHCACCDDEDDQDDDDEIDPDDIP